MVEQRVNAYQYTLTAILLWPFIPVDVGSIPAPATIRQGSSVGRARIRRV